MSHLGVRIPQKLLAAIKKSAEDQRITVTQFVVDALHEKFLMREMDLTDWRFKTVDLLKISLSQLDYAFTRSRSPQEVISYLSSMSKIAMHTVVHGDVLIMQCSISAKDYSISVRIHDTEVTVKRVFMQLISEIQNIRSGVEDLLEDTLYDNAI